MLVFVEAPRPEERYLFLGDAGAVAVPFGRTMRGHLGRRGIFPDRRSLVVVAVFGLGIYVLLGRDRSGLALGRLDRSVRRSCRSWRSRRGRGAVQGGGVLGQVLHVLRVDIGCGRRLQDRVIAVGDVRVLDDLTGFNDLPRVVDLLGGKSFPATEDLAQIPQEGLQALVRGVSSRPSPKKKKFSVLDGPPRPGDKVVRKDSAVKRRRK